MNDSSKQGSPKVCATGFNAFQQLSNGDPKQDATTFKPFPPEGIVPDVEITKIFHTSWSSTAFIADAQLYSLGFQHFTTDLPLQNPNFELRCPFGDHNGLIGCLDSEGRIYYLTPSNQDLRSGERTAPLICASTADAPLLSQIARADNERVVVTFKQTLDARLTHVVEFASVEDFRKWHSNPSGESRYPVAHHVLPGRPKQLCANAATFILLMQGGEVYTWGDPRFRTLARSTVGEGAAPANEPGIVEALGGLRIERIVCGGWLGAALSEGAMYLWGTSAPGGEGAIQCLKEAGAGEVLLVELPSSSGEPLDILDASIGSNHVVVVAEGGRLFAVGENRNGQLGLGSERLFFEDWTEVDALNTVQSVHCGPWATFVSAA